MNEEDLVFRAQAGDSAATEQILLRYKNAVRSVARSFFLAGGETEDLIQEGMCGLYFAIQGFRRGKMSFKNFAYLCIYRRIVSAVKSASGKKHNPLNESVPLSEEEIEKYNFGDDPEEALLMDEWRREFTEDMKKYLSDGEYECIRLYIAGHSLAEIAARTRRSEKSADNAVQRAKKKIQKNLREE